MEPGHPAADRLLRRLDGSARRELRQCVQGAVGAVPQARRRRGQVPLEPARSGEGRAARRAGAEELEAEEVARRAEAQIMKTDAGMRLRKLGSFGAEADEISEDFRQ